MCNPSECFLFEEDGFSDKEVYFIKRNTYSNCQLKYESVSEFCLSITKTAHCRSKNTGFAIRDLVYHLSAP
jgi:hypothetical protein